MSHSLIQKALSEFEKLSADDQDAVAARWLEELRDEQIWAEKFADTTDEQWDKLADLVRKDIARGDTTDLDSFLDEISSE